MNIAQAQQDMRHAYYGGATGILASSLVWLLAASVSLFYPTKTAILTLIVGGMLIHPAAMIFSKWLGRPGAHQKGNPLGALALETTVYLLLGIVLAFIISMQRVEWFFPAMLLVIGGRYLTFSTLYGMRVYWICGAALAATGFLSIFMHATATVSAFSGGLIELGFALTVFVMTRRKNPSAVGNIA